MIQSFSLSAFIWFYKFSTFLNYFLVVIVPDKRISRIHPVWRDTLNNTASPSLIKTQIKSELRQNCLLFFLSIPLKFSSLLEDIARANKYALIKLSSLRVFQGFRCEASLAVD